MNPFDLAGPEFLLFYAAYGGLVLIGLVLARRRRESGPAPRIDLSDAYLVAYLRAGRDEAVRVALVSLVDRKLVIPGDPMWRAADGAADAAAHPLERALVRQLAGQGDKPDAERWDPAVEQACTRLRRELQRLGLLPDGKVDETRLRRVAIAALLLAVPAAIKVAVALERGRLNIAILIVMAVGFAGVACLLRGGRLTERGRRVLVDLQALFAGLRQRAGSVAPGDSADVAMLAGLFGTAVLPAAAFPHAQALVAPAPPELAGRGCSASVSSCGSTAGTDAGGDGGGGGGGGCGGCSS